MFNPSADLFKWGPIDGKPIYMDGFIEAFESFLGDGGTKWPDLFGYFKDDRVTFFVDQDEMNLSGKVLFTDYLTDKDYLEKKYGYWLVAAGLIENHALFVNNGLSYLSTSELIDEFKKFRKLVRGIWHGEFVPELSNYAGGPLLKDRVLKLNSENFVQIFEKITAPVLLSFMQREEVDLLSIKLISDDKERQIRLGEHQKKYYWLHNSYAGTEIIPESFFAEQLDKISVDQAQKRLAEISGYIEKVKNEKAKVIDKYKIPKEIVLLADTLSFSIWWQDHHKKYTYLMCHIIAKYLEEIGRRCNVATDDLEYYHLSEIEQLLQSNMLVNISDRSIGFLVSYQSGRELVWTEGAKAVNFVEPYLNFEVNKRVTEFRGMVVSQGKEKIVRAKVKIILAPKDTAKLEVGEILVAPMTSPEFVIAMRKASAIVTDTGGITSHAAIISRELGTPCIVGTKFATQVLKDGDLVEVDANKGTVKILGENNGTD